MAMARNPRDRGAQFGRQRDEDPSGFTERVVFTRRIAKVVKGGRRLRFNALVAFGEGKGKAGSGRCWEGGISLRPPMRSGLRSTRMGPRSRRLADPQAPANGTRTRILRA